MARWPALLALLLLALACTAHCSAGNIDDETGGSWEEQPRCQPADGTASFGILFGGGNDPLAPRPLDLLRLDGPAATPVANPVLTPAQLGVEEIADPILVHMGKSMTRIFMFFAARPCGGGRWGIAAAQSDDGGASWKALGFVLQDPEVDLRHPIVFGHNKHWYLVPDVPAELEQVWLYRASPLYFPRGWRFFRVAVEEALSGVNIVRQYHKWWLLGSAPGNGLDGQDHVLRLFASKSPLGPWEPHLGGTLAAEGALTMGKVFTYKNSLHRLGRSCRAGVCGPVEVHQVFISDESFEQDTLQLDFGKRLWRQHAAWDSAGWTFLSIEKRNDGNYVAVMEASRLPPAEPQLPGQLEAAVVAFRRLALASIVLLLLTGAARVPPLRRALEALPCCRRPLFLWALCLPSRKRCKLEDGTPPPSPLTVGGSALVRLVVEQPSHSQKAATAAVQSKGLAVRVRSSSSLAPRCRGSGSSSCDSGSPDPIASRAGRARHTVSIWRRLLALLPLLLASAALLMGLGGSWAAHTAANVAEPFLVPPVPLPVGGQYSKFTLMVMSYDARLRELQWYVRHYSRCPSVGEVLVVWNRGPAPNPRTAFQSDVPVRVRVEHVNSMNNRFRPDPSIKFRAVLSLDDDILLPCSDVEAAFATWRAAPHQLVGWYPRLLVPEEGSWGSTADLPPVYRFEEFVFEQGAYNAILAGAAFMDSATLFPAYSSAAAGPGRELVDEVFNCDDLLLNFVAANLTRAASAAAAAIQLLRPTRRLDLSRLSGVGISHNPARFKTAADRCLAEFSALFGGSPLRVQQLEPGFGPPPDCWWPFDCMYLSDAR